MNLYQYKRIKKGDIIRVLGCQDILCPVKKLCLEKTYIVKRHDDSRVIFNTDLLDRKHCWVIPIKDSFEIVK